MKNGYLETVIEKTGELIADGMTFTYNTTECKYDIGTHVYIKSGSFTFIFISKDEYDINDKVQRQKVLQDELQRQEGIKRHDEKRNQHKEEVHLFNRSLKIPFKWTTGIKAVTSGLTEGSWGDGRNKRSVTHVIVLEDAKEGRLTRSKGDCLCTAKRGKFQYNDSLNGDVSTDEITCPKCLEIINRKEWVENE